MVPQNVVFLWQSRLKMAKAVQKPWRYTSYATDLWLDSRWAQVGQLRHSWFWFVEMLYGLVTASPRHCTGTILWSQVLWRSFSWTHGANRKWREKLRANQKCSRHTARHSLSCWTKRWYLIQPRLFPIVSYFSYISCSLFSWLFQVYSFRMQERPSRFTLKPGAV